MKCYAESYCTKDRSFCSDLCGAYRVLRALYNLSHMPKKYQYEIALECPTADLDIFHFLADYKENIVKKVEDGEGLYIWGKSTGSGKTSWACKIMSHYFRKITFTTGLENEGLYIFLPSFLEDLRANYDNKDPEFELKLDMAKHCKLLIIDDIGAETPSEWVRERLIALIHDRSSNGLCTIYTSNLSPEELLEGVGARVASRVLGYSTVLEITGKDRRMDK